MVRFLRQIKTSFLRNFSFFALLIIWMLGLLSGAIFAAISDNSYFLMMRAAANCRVSIFGLIAYAYFPFLLSTFVVIVDRRWLLLFICFLKASLFSWCFVGIFHAFHSAGWLVRFFLQFTDLFLVPMLCWFSLRRVTYQKFLIRKDLAICTLVFALLGCFDYCVVSPFLTMLIDI